jgi:tetratricopeptide (TPR) repeat protein
MKKILLPLLLLSSALQASEKDNLLNTSSDIVNQITTGVTLVGAATEYAHQGDALSSGTLSTTAHISEAQVDAYNQALDNFVNNYQPYGDVKAVLENKAMGELELMDEAIGRFTEAVVDMSTVLQVNERIEEAVTPQQEAEVQTFVTESASVLQVKQETVDTYNQSVDEIETHANNASAYLAVAGSEEAVAFLEQGIEKANTTAEQTNIFYDANEQWVAMGYNTTRNLTAVYLNGNDNMGLDLYITEADILAAGSESEFFQTSPVAQGYKCFMYNEGCNEL